MRIKIEKPNQHAPIRVELTTDTSKKPLVLELRPNQAQGLIDIVKAAIAADCFAFTMEM